ncbi:hypothetical protein ACIP98_07805 [Streptomyces sp. NPDC088354]|nr:hypothetical protein [Streptomyces sp. MI02-7b]MDX3071365.1 hypothetical protein [Streptomyces sp. MI02-7b]
MTVAAAPAQTRQGRAVPGLFGAAGLIVPATVTATGHTSVRSP